MSYGACNHCGCSHHECECLSINTGSFSLMESFDFHDAYDRAPSNNHFTIKTMPKITKFSHHGSHIHDYRVFEIERKLGLAEAYELLKASAWIQDKPIDRMDCIPETYLANNEWAIVDINRDSNTVKVVHNHYGRYVLYQAGLQAFMERTRSMITWSPYMRNLHDTLNTPHEHA